MFQNNKQMKKFDSDLIISLTKQQQKTEKGNLYIGSASCLNNQHFSQNKIRSVLSVLDTYTFQMLEIQQKIKKIERKKQIDIQDDQDCSIYQFISEALFFLSQQLKEGNVLVHCQGGRSRSGSIVIAFLMKELQISYENAKKIVRSKRCIVEPNQSFQRDLYKYEETLKESKEK